MAAHVTYDGTNLILTLTDIVVNKVFTHTFPINIPATIGSNVAYIGFTGGTGGESFKPENIVLDVHLAIGIGDADTRIFAGRRKLYHGATGDAERCNCRRRHLLHHGWFGSYHFLDRVQLSYQRG